MRSEDRLRDAYAADIAPTAWWRAALERRAALKFFNAAFRAAATKRAGIANCSRSS
jgi:hypothetical protein